MAYLNRSWPRVRAETNLYEPPLNYNSGYFDAVYSVSIWSHLPPQLQQPWLDEIRRVVKPGGLALITISETLRSVHIEARTRTFQAS